MSHVLDPDKLFNEQARLTNLETPVDRFLDLILAVFRSNVLEAYQRFWTTLTEDQIPVLFKTRRFPALTLPSQETIGETAAIVITLGEHFPSSGLTPQPGQADRALFLFWLSVMATAGYMTVARHGHPERYAFDETAISEVEQQAAKDLEIFFNKVEAAIMGKTTFLASGFSAVDLYLAMLTGWSAVRDRLFENRPAMRTVCRSVVTRPAYKTAMQTHR